MATKIIPFLYAGIGGTIAYYVVSTIIRSILPASNIEQPPTPINNLTPFLNPVWSLVVLVILLVALLVVWIWSKKRKQNEQN